MSIKMESNITHKKFSLKANKIKFIEKELKKLDNNFQMPQVLKPYLRYCSVSYENYSIAERI